MTRRASPAPLLLLLLAACRGASPVPPTPAVPAPALAARLDAEGERWVAETTGSLTLREAVGQLIMPWMSGAYTSTTDSEFVEFARLAGEGAIGGVVISIGLPHTYAAKLNALQERARLPLLVASDFESGGPGMRIGNVYAVPTLLPQGGGTAFPPTMAFGAIGDPGMAFEYGRVTAVEARAVGVHLNFAPVLDVNSNPLNPIINTRSFGEDPELVARLGAAYLAGARAGGVLTTAKHFPGHGDTRTDSHIELPVVQADRARLDSMELVPFRRAVSEGVDAVMTAHVAVPAILGPDGPPATLSPVILTGLLREEMGFQGLVLTDALRMGAISGRYGVGESAVMALEAGADVLLAPADVEETLEAVVQAVEEGRVSRARIDASVRRLLTLKARVGLHRTRTVNLGRIAEVVGSAEHRRLADSAAVLSLTLPRDRHHLIPADPRAYDRVLHVAYARSENVVAGRAFSATLGAFFREVETRRVEPGTLPAKYADLAREARGFDLVVVTVSVPPRAGIGRADVAGPFAHWVSETAAEVPTVVVSLGSPYLLTSFPEIGTYLLAWGPTEVSQRAAARALVGEVGISGRLPISLPPFHRLGEGLDRRAVPGVPRLGGRGGVGEEAIGGGREGEENPEAAGAVRPSAVRPGTVKPGAVRRGAAGVSRAGGGGEEKLPSVGGAPAAPVTPSPLEVPAETLGMSSEGLAAVDSLILAALADSASPGAALAVGRHGRIVRLRGYGRLDWGPDSPPATPSSIWDLASLTKVAATTTAAMILAEEGWIDLDDRVVDYLPWWAAGDRRKEAVTLRQLLLHRAGLPPFRRFYEELSGREAIREAIGRLPLETDPGEGTVYSDIGLMTLGFVIEEVTGRSLDAFLQDRVLAPLGMQDTGFNPDSSLLDRIAPTEVDSLYRFTHVHGVVHDENAFAMGGVAGHAGLFSSARDLAVLAQMLLNGGTVGPCGGEENPGTGEAGVPCSAPRPSPVRIVAPTTVELFTRRWDTTSSRALGWDTPREGSSSGEYLSASAFGHTGFTGTSLWIDPELDLFVVLLTSRTNPTRANQRHVELRRAVHDAVARAVLDRVVERRRW